MASLPVFIRDFIKLIFTSTLYCLTQNPVFTQVIAMAYCSPFNNRLSFSEEGLEEAIGLEHFQQDLMNLPMGLET